MVMCLQESAHLLIQEKAIQGVHPVLTKHVMQHFTLLNKNVLFAFWKSKST